MYQDPQPPTYLDADIFDPTNFCFEGRHDDHYVMLKLHKVLIVKKIILFSKRTL
jgi:hypothetical protein